MTATVLRRHWASTCNPLRWWVEEGDAMSGKGPAPKPADQRRRRNQDPVGTKVLQRREFVPPDLPEGFPWPERTQQWWLMWQRSPQAAHFTETDWDSLLDTALIHADVWGNYNLDRLPELRLRVAKFGATTEDRDRLRMKFVDAEEPPAAEVTRISAAARGRRLQIADAPSA